MNALPKLLGRVLLLLPLLLGLLSGCAVYERVAHPRRLPTPAMTPEAKAKARAAEKARHKGLSLKAADPDAEGTTATDPAAAADEKKTTSYRDLPEGTRVKYDKQGLVKTGTLKHLDINRRQLHHYNLRPDKPREASRENRELRKKGHQKPGKKRDDDQPRGQAPADPDAEPAAVPTPPPAPKAKVPVPKPGPTQPAPGNGP